MSLGAALERAESGLAEIKATVEGTTSEEHVADSWYSLSIIPDDGQDPRIDLLSLQVTHRGRARTSLADRRGRPLTMPPPVHVLRSSALPRAGN